MSALLFGFASSTTQVANPTFSPPSGGYNVYPASTKTITLSDSNVSAHIFYTKDGTSPTHSGDSPAGSTFRIGSNNGTVVLPVGDWTIKMVAYVNGLTDSNVVSGDYSIERDSGA